MIGLLNYFYSLQFLSQEVNQALNIALTFLHVGYEVFQVIRCAVFTMTVRVYPQSRFFIGIITVIVPFNGIDKLICISCLTFDIETEILVGIGILGKIEIYLIVVLTVIVNTPVIIFGYCCDTIDKFLNALSTESEVLKLPGFNLCFGNAIADENDGVSFSKTSEIQ